VQTTKLDYNPNPYQLEKVLNLLI